MARTLNVRQVVMYRALIEVLRDDEWVELYAFGPYSLSGMCRDHGAGWSPAKDAYAAGTRRKRVQKQVVVSDGMDPLSGRIEWVDV